MRLSMAQLCSALIIIPSLSHYAFAQEYGAPPGLGNEANRDRPITMNLVGTWSGDRQLPNLGFTHQTVAFSRDGSFASVTRIENNMGGLLPNGTVLRAWGRYSISQDAPNQLRVSFEESGMAPSSICRQSPGAAPQCTRLPRQPTDVVMLTFASPESFTAEDKTTPGTPQITENRDSNPVLLHAPVQQQLVIQMPPAAMPQPNYAPMQPGYAPPTIHPYVTPPGIGIGGGGSAGAGGSRCDDLQQQRICTINDGHLISSGGCMVCVSP